METSVKLFLVIVTKVLDTLLDGMCRDGEHDRRQQGSGVEAVLQFLVDTPFKNK